MGWTCITSTDRKDKRMSTVLKASEFIRRAKDIAVNKETFYVLGCFGAPMNAKNRKRYSDNNDFNRSRARLINELTDNTFGFDCVCLIKGILWGFNADKSKNYGGAVYKANGVPDIGADSMIKQCTKVSTDFSNIVAGEAVWLEGHIGIYIGDGLAVECTPKWANKVQITAVGNIGRKSGYYTRTWTKHGRLPWVDYSASSNGTALPKNDASINRKYIVRKGDSLWSIASKELGKGMRYKEIMTLNGLTTTHIYPNQVLKIPNK